MNAAGYGEIIAEAARLLRAADLDDVARSVEGDRNHVVVDAIQNAVDSAHITTGGPPTDVFAYVALFAVDGYFDDGTRKRVRRVLAAALRAIENNLVHDANRERLASVVLHRAIELLRDSGDAAASTKLLHVEGEAHDEIVNAMRLTDFTYRGDADMIAAYVIARIAVGAIVRQNRAEDDALAHYANNVRFALTKWVAKAMALAEANP